jgi:hypothetical protein
MKRNFASQLLSLWEPRWIGRIGSPRLRNCLNEWLNPRAHAREAALGRCSLHKSLQKLTHHVFGTKFRGRLEKSLKNTKIIENMQRIWCSTRARFSLYGRSPSPTRRGALRFLQLERVSNLRDANASVLKLQLKCESQRLALANHA